MELFGIVLAIPAAFIAAAIYSLLMRFVLPYRLINRAALWLSTAVLGGLLVEWGALLAIGAVRSRAIIGPTFYPLHLVILFLTVPALANLLIIKRGGGMLGSWFAVALLCSVLALPVVVTQYVVAHPFGAEPIGIFIYTPTGYVSIHIMHNPPPKAFNDLDLSREEQDHAEDRSYVGYFGTYRVDARRAVVIHHVAGGTRLGYIGHDEERPFRLEGDKLIIGDGRTWRRVLVRVPAK